VILKEHRKHAGLARPSFGNFNRNEWAFVGGQCNAIKALAGEIIGVLSANYKCAYADTSHNDDKVLPGRLVNGAVIEVTDEINYSTVNDTAPFNSFRLKAIFSGVDIVLVNGNHQQAKAQVVIICESKKASLQKRLAQLTNVQMLLLAEGAADVFDFIKEAVPNWSSIPLYRMDETEKIIGFFQNKMALAKPVLNGLVLAGGKSERMGFDKGMVNWHGTQQRYHLADLLAPFCEDVFISVRNRQEQEIDPHYYSLTDTFSGLGPFGAILSAFREKPDNAWLVVACDLPLINKGTLQYLTANRNTATIATAYQSGTDGFPEPLIAIWEPKSYPVLLSFLAQGYSCPRKVLINSETALLNAPHPGDLTNVNTPEEFEQLKSMLKQTY
jgi:molybdopterin-guanine dinucleotide biosynthesis protein A